MNILLTSAGRRVSLVRAFQAELASRHPNGRVFTADLVPALSAASQVADGAFQLPPVTAPTYVQALLTLCEREGVTCIVPTIDTELIVLAHHRDTFLKAGIQVIVSDVSLVEQCRDKYQTNALFADYQINTPILIDRHQPVFPLFIKPRDGSLSQDIHLIRRAEDLLPRFQDERFIWMQYCDKQDYEEYTVDLYYDRQHRLRCVVPRLRIEVRGGEVSKGQTRQNCLVKFFTERLGKLPGARGCLTAQVFLHRRLETVLGIEINPRFGGGYPLSYRAGANYPGWLIDEYIDDLPVERFDDWADNLLMLRYDAEILVYPPQT
jgi:carbamoyl-phosphate synthase large subunit